MEQRIAISRTMECGSWDDRPCACKRCGRIPIVCLQHGEREHAYIKTRPPDEDHPTGACHIELKSCLARGLTFGTFKKDAFSVKRDATCAERGRENSFSFAAAAIKRTVFAPRHGIF